MFCEEEVEIEHLLEVGQEVSCPACLQQYEVISTNPFQVQPDNISYDDVLENPEKQARARRMQHRSKLDSDVDEEENPIMQACVPVLWETQPATQTNSRLCLRSR